MPLIDLRDPEDREKIRPSLEEVDDLVLEYGGSISTERNDGLLRGPYTKNMFGEEIFKIFKDIKKIFDPQNIFNPPFSYISPRLVDLGPIKKPSA